MSEIIRYKNYIEFNDNYYFHPGYYIEELIDSLGLSQSEFAAQMNTSEKTLSLLVNGKQSLTRDLASKLSRMTGMSAGLWLGYQSAYDAAEAEIKSQESLEADKAILSDLDYQYFIDYFNAPASTRSNWKEKIKWLRQIFSLSSLTILKEPDLSLNFRTLGSELREKNIVCTNAMLMLARKQFRKDEPPFETERFEETVNALKMIMNQTEPNIPQVRDILSRGGIELVFLPNLRSSKIRGAVKKQGKRMLLMVTDSRHNLDSFWFTLFHELGHINNGDTASITISGASNINDNSENAADLFARDQLIPKKDYERFIEQNDFSLTAISTFSKEIKRIPSIVIGRLISDKYLDYKRDSNLIASEKIDFYADPTQLDYSR